MATGKIVIGSVVGVIVVIIGLCGGFDSRRSKSGKSGDPKFTLNLCNSFNDSM